MVNKYFIWLQERFYPRIPVVDVKYRSMHHWNGGWQGVVELPWLVRYIRDKKLPLLHLKRSNLIETYVSGKLAEENQVWHAASAEEVSIREIAVDIRQMSNALVDTMEEINIMDRWLKQIRKLVTIEYAELFNADGLASQKHMTKIKNLFELRGDFENLKPAFVKQAPHSVATSITNVALVERSLRGTEFVWMLKPDSGP